MGREGLAISGTGIVFGSGGAVAVALALVLALVLLLRNRSLCRQLRAQAAELARQEDLPRALLDASPDPAMLLREDGQVLACNRAAADRLGRGSEDVEGLSLGEVFPAPVAEWRFERLQEALQAPDGIQVEETSRGYHYQTFLLALPDDPAGERRVAVFARDVTAETAALERWKASERRFRAIADYTYHWENWFDVDGKLLWVNPAVERVTGYSPDECLAMERFPGPIIHEDHREEVLREVGKAAEPTWGNDREFRFVRKDGEVRWGAVSWQPIYDEEGRCLGHRSSVRDIQKRKEMEQRMLQVQKLESLGVLAGGIAHDFNNLLMGVLGNAEMLLEDLPAESPSHGLAARIKQAGDRAAELSQQMLAYSGGGQVSVEPVDLAKLVEDVSPLLEASLPAEVRLELALGEDVPALEGDATQLRQVAMNLVINAAEAYGAEGGAVRVVAERRWLDRSFFDECVLEEGQPPGEYVVLSVLDHGCGIETPAVSRIFEPFFSTKFTGRGLGLASVLGIVRSHGGGIHVDTAPGEGTRLTIALPPLQQPVRPPDSQTAGSSDAVPVLPAGQPENAQ